MRRHGLLACMLTACQLEPAIPSPTGPTDATDAGLDATDDTEPVWDTDTDGPDDSRDPSFGDPPLGPTPLDGTWTGTFELTDVVIATENPKCEGPITLQIDGDALRHVSVSMSCDTWDPNFDLLPGTADAYGPLTGFGFATLDPANYGKATLHLTLSAANMPEFDDDNVVVRFDGDTATIDYDNVAGIGSLRAGRKISAVATRESGG